MQLIPERKLVEMNYNFKYLTRGKNTNLQSLKSRCFLYRALIMLLLETSYGRRLEKNGKNWEDSEVSNEKNEEE